MTGVVAARRARITRLRRRPTLAAAAVVALVALLLTGCGHRGSLGAASLGAQALENLSPFERNALKDKYVTAAEFDQSMRIYIDCLTKAGLTYEIAPGEFGMRSVWVYGPARPDPSGRPDDGMQRCVDRVDAVQEVWVLQTHRSASGFAASQRALVSCLRAAGLPIIARATISEANTALSTFVASLPDPRGEGNAPPSVTARNVYECQQHYQSLPDARPLPGLREALNHLNTATR